VNYLIALIVGTLAGLHTSTWGMYKDAPHEGFTWPKYFRSTIIGAILGLGTYPFVSDWDMTQPSSMFLFFGLIYVEERGVTEFWKSFLREEDQSKYFIPMQFGVFGKPIKNAPKRIAIGLVYAAVVVGAFLGVLLLGRADLGWPTWLVVITVGSVGGWISAFGGAWKDAPIEGFETFKFFRSPGVATFYASICAHFTDSYAIISMAALGFTVASIETYKTFFFPNKPRGKFSGMPIHHPEMLDKRKNFVPLYASIWVFILVTGALSFMAPHRAFIF
jgi:hypothetical protein